MSKSPVFSVLALLLSLLGTSAPGLAQEPLLTKMEGEGWSVVQQGVLQRQLNAGEIETFVYGVEGLAWKLRDLRDQLRNLRTLFQADPTPELKKTIRNHRKEIANTIEAIERARITGARGLPGIAKSCTFNLAYNADGGSRTDVQGPWASANASFNASPDCNYSGEVYAYAFTSAWLNGATTTDTVTDGPRSGSNVSASAYSQRSGASPCESYSYSTVTSSNLNPSSYSKSKQSYTCAVPPAPLQVTVTSTHGNNLTLYTGICLQIAWSVSTSNGTSPYTTKIYLNNVFKTNGTTYWEWICAPAPGITQTYTLRADVTDSLGNTGSGSHTTTITGQ